MKGDSLFDIFSGERNRQAARNVTRQPLSNVGNENIGKLVPGKPAATPQGKPFKLNEPVKSKKTFLANAGQALQNTPAREMFSPRIRNVGAMIYTDEDPGYCSGELEFTKPAHKNEPYSCELYDVMPKLVEDATQPSTPSPKTRQLYFEFDYSNEDEFFTNESNFTISDEELELPALY